MKKLGLIVLIGLFVGINLLLSPFALRLDLSKGKAYSLSSSTKKIISNLDKPVSIKFFVSSDIPTKLIPLKNDVVDLLNEYKKRSGKVDLKIVDPKTDKKVLDEATAAGIPELQYSQLDQDKYAISKVYFGILITYLDKKELLSQVSDTASLEYNLTSAIYKLSNKSLARVEIMGQTATGDPNTQQLGNLSQVLRQQLDVSFSDKIDNSVKTILVFDDGKKEYSDEEINGLKEYLNNGGKVVFFSDKVWIGDNITTSPAKNNLEKIYNDYGVSVNNNLILSANSELVNFGGTQSSFFAPYPFWLKTNSFNPKTSYFSNITQMTFPWVSSISVTKKNNIDVTPIITSTDRSWEQKNTFILDPQKIPQPQLKDLGKKLLAVDVKSKKRGEFILIPSSRFVLDRYLSQGSGNLEFIINVVNDFASSGALTGIRQREVSFYPLPDLSEDMKNVFKYTNIFLLPLGFAIYGAIRLTKRK